MGISRHPGRAITLAALLSAGCSTGTAPTPPPLPPDAVTANVYILPQAASLGANAFGDEPIVVYRGERLRWRNADAEAHNIVADTASLPEFTATGLLGPGGERSFVMNTAGTTGVHCTIHPQMTGTLVVR